MGRSWRFLRLSLENLDPYLAHMQSLTSGVFSYSYSKIWFVLLKERHVCKSRLWLFPRLSWSLELSPKLLSSERFYCWVVQSWMFGSQILANQLRSQWEWPQGSICRGSKAVSHPSDFSGFQVAYILCHTRIDLVFSPQIYSCCQNWWFKHLWDQSLKKPRKYFLGSELHARNYFLKISARFCKLFLSEFWRF